jgi:hypothetical protein
MLILGDDASFTMITVGMKFKISSKKLNLIKSGTKRTKVTKTKSKVMAELASLVLSTSIEIRIPTPIKPKPIKNNIKSNNMGL